MSVKLENIVVGFTCPECEREETSGLDALVVVGAPMCEGCDVEMEADSTADVLQDDDKFDAAMAELDAAYTDLRSETYPYPTQYQRVEDAKLALRAAAGIA